MNNIRIFNNPQFGDIRTTGTANEPWFCLADLCRILELQTGATKNRLDQRGINLINTPTSSGNQQMVFVNEKNLYKVIMRSDKPQAEPFQDWVCGEVLPSIRKTGGYMVSTPEMTDEEIMARAILLGQQTIKRQKERIAELECKSSVQEQLINEQRPKWVFAEAIVGSTSSILIGELAKNLRQNGIQMGEKRLFRWMRENGYLGSHGERYNIPNQRYIEMGLFELKTNTFSINGEMRTRSTTKVTGKGQQYFINKFLNMPITHN